MTRRSLPLYDEKNIIDRSRQTPSDEQGRQILKSLLQPQYQRRGAIIPWHWKKFLMEAHGCCYGSVMADILGYVADFWMPSTEVLEGGYRGVNKRFRFNLPQIGYWLMERKMGYPKVKLQRALQRLEVAGVDGKPLVKRYSQFVRQKTGQVAEEMFLMLYPEHIEELMGWQERDDEEVFEDTPDFDLFVNEDGEEVERIERTEVIIEDLEDLTEDLDVAPPATRQPTQEPVLVESSSDREMTGDEMNEIILCQKTSDTSVSLRVRELLLKRIRPVWRNDWGIYGVKPEFLDFLKTEFSKADWGEKTTPQAWISAREHALSGSWEKILIYWQKFQAQEDRRVQVQAAKPEIVAATDDVIDELLPLKNAAAALAIALSTPMPKSFEERQVDTLTKAWEKAIADGLDLTEIKEQYANVLDRYLTCVA